MARKNWYEIFDRSTKDAHSWRKLSVSVRGISVLQDGTLENICVLFTIWTSVIRNHAFISFYNYFCPTIAVRECDK